MFEDNKTKLGNTLFLTVLTLRVRYILIIGIPKYKYKVKTLLISGKVCVLVHSESFNTSLAFYNFGPRNHHVTISFKKFCYHQEHHAPSRDLCWIKIFLTWPLTTNFFFFSFFIYTHKIIVSVNSRGHLDKSLIFLSKRHLLYAVGVSFQTALFSCILIWI